MLDLLRALKRPKSGRALGPDLLPIETLKLMPYILKHFLFNYYNYYLLSTIAPIHWKLAKIIINKDNRSPSNYRPLLFTNSIYKIYIFHNLITFFLLY